MTRWISLLFIFALATTLALMPGAPPENLAALNVHRLLEQPVEPDSKVTLADRILFGPASEETAPGERTVRFPGFRVTSDLGGDNLDLGNVARRSVARGLRERAHEKKIELDLIEMGGQGATALVEIRDGSIRMEVQHPGTDEPNHEANVDWEPPTRWSLFPPFIAILIAILFRRPVLALLLGVLGGIWLLVWTGHQSAALGDQPIFFERLSEITVAEAKNTEHLFIIGFVVCMLAMVGILTRAGGIRGLMDWIARFASNAKRTQIATWFMGLAVFFDDYANTILVGSTMRPLTDRFKIAREKLAYIVDSTAAPVAGLSLFSTWIAYEVSTFSAQLPAAGLTRDQGYAVFIDTLPYRFYCIFTLVFVGFVVFTGRDFGPMLKAERRARKEGKLVADGGKPMVGAHMTALEPAANVKPNAWCALIPLAGFIFGTIGVLLYKGIREANLDSGELFTLTGFSEVLYGGSGSQTLFWGSFIGLSLAVLFAALAGITKEIPLAAWNSLRSMGVALVILFLAWMLGAVCKELETATYLSVLLSDTLAPALLPTLLFLLAAIVAFSTGSSWSTMSILLPLVVGLSYNLGSTIEIGGMTLMLLSIGAVLEGAIFGDHCSPISDTTVLSSIASASDHIDHVRTQAPYAILTMVFAIAFGYLPCAFLGASPLVALSSGIAALLVFLFWRGKKADVEALAPSEAPSA